MPGDLSFFSLSYTFSTLKYGTRVLLPCHKRPPFSEATLEISQLSCQMSKTLRAAIYLKLAWSEPVRRSWFPVTPHSGSYLWSPLNTALVSCRDFSRLSQIGRQCSDCSRTVASTLSGMREKYIEMQETKGSQEQRRESNLLSSFNVKGCIYSIQILSLASVCLYMHTDCTLSKEL